MKVGKKTIIIMLIICVIVLCVSFLLEYINCNAEIVEKMHIEFYKNLCLGMFASGLLVLIPAIVQYNTEKSNYYVDMHQYLDSLLYDALDIMSVMEKYDRNADIAKKFDSFAITYNKIVSLYSSFTYFFILTKKDKLIESIINETTKFIMIQVELLKQSKKMKNQEITENEYNTWFEVVRAETIKTYWNEFSYYKDLVEKNMKSLLDNRQLKTYTNL